MFHTVSPLRTIKYARSLQALHQYIVNLIQQRRECPQKDLTSDLVQAIASCRAELSLPEAVNTICHLIGAGHETTVNSLNTCLYYLLKERRYWLAIQNDPGLISNIVEEVLRFDPALRGPLRTTTQEVILGGVRLPK